MSVSNPSLIDGKSALQQALKDEFRDEEYRYAYAESFLNTKLASQIKTIRQQRKCRQVDIADLMGIKQSGYARFEDVNHSSWKTDTLWKIARALGVRVNISLETFGALIEDKLRFSQKNLERPSFEEDPALKEADSSDLTALRNALDNVVSGELHTSEDVCHSWPMERLSPATDRNSLAALDAINSDASGAARQASPPTGPVPITVLKHRAKNKEIRKRRNHGRTIRKHHTTAATRAA